MDGLFLIVLDRQQHAWPTVYKAADSGIPTVAFAPLGTAFTTNTWKVAGQPGVFIASTDDFGQAEWGLKMIGVMARMREMRFLVIAGEERREKREAHFGTRLRYLPKREFVEEYRNTPESVKIRQMAEDYIAGAVRIQGATGQDVVNGIRSFQVRVLVGQP